MSNVPAHISNLALAMVNEYVKAKTAAATNFVHISNEDILAALALATGSLLCSKWPPEKRERLLNAHTDSIWRMLKAAKTRQ